MATADITAFVQKVVDAMDLDTDRSPLRTVGTLVDYVAEQIGA